MTRFCLLRILGNDLPPMHSPSQSIENLKLVLEQEAALPECEKMFVLNRVVDEACEHALLALLGDAHMPVYRIPFDADEYRRCGSYAQKMHYVSNNNPARNVALSEGLRRAPVALPFDGQLFFTAAGWDQFVRAVDSAVSAVVFVVPMYRLADNSDIHRPLHELQASEPQLAFARGAGDRFDPGLPYGAAPKVDLLLRLGVPGPWDHWPGELFQGLRQRAAAHRSPDSGRTATAGHVLRLAPGNPRTVHHIGARNAARQEGLRRLVARLDARLGASGSAAPSVTREDADDGH